MDGLTTGSNIGSRAGGGIASPVTPSPELADIVGKSDLPRSEVVSKLWEYSRKHDLQDAKDRRQINGNEKLGEIVAKNLVSMLR